MPVYIKTDLGADKISTLYAGAAIGAAYVKTAAGADLLFQSGVQLSGIAEGKTIMLPEAGADVAFYIAKHNYESGLNGSGYTLVVRKDIYNNQPWSTSGINAYAASSIDVFLNSTYKTLLGASVQNNIQNIKFHYTPGSGNNTVISIAREIFLLSGTEYGVAPSANVEGGLLPTADIIRIAYLGSSANTYWTRSPNTFGNNRAWGVSSTGGQSSIACTTPSGCRPAFTLPATMQFELDGNGSYRSV